MPTLMGRDSDSSWALGEVGRAGVAIDTLADIDLSSVSTSMTINGPAAIILSISGYHIREAGSTAAQELAFTLANGFAYVEAATAAGVDVDEFAGRLSFFFNSHNDFLEEIGKFRAARRIWARWMKERYGATSERSMLCRFHTQTAGVSLTAQQPEINIARVAIQALAGALGGTQSLHTDSFDEALALLTEKAARIALRTQQIVAHETGVANVADPLGGSDYVEWMTNEMERQAEAIFAHLDDLGQGSILEGVYEGIENGYLVGEIADSAYRFEREVNNGDRIIVGVNAFTDGDEGQKDLLRVEAEVEEYQRKRLADVKLARDDDDVARTLAAATAAAKDPAINVMASILDAVKAYATLEEVAMAMETEFGTYVEKAII